MSASKNLLITALLGVGSGYVAGLLLAPQSGKKARESLVEQFRSQTHRLEVQLHRFDDQLERVENEVGKYSEMISGKVREVRDKTLDQYVPLRVEDDEPWEVQDKELTRDLRRMPRS